MLDISLFKSVVQNTALFAFDIIIKEKSGRILLGLRNNEPAKNYWFVPGGRVFKNENLETGLKRILFNETGLLLMNQLNVKFKGLYDHIYENNFWNDPAFNTHYIVCCVEVVLVNDIQFENDNQNEQLAFFSINELLRNDRVHQFTKNYFIDKPDNKLVINY